LIKEIKKLNSDIQIYGHGAGAHIIVRFPVSDQKEFQKKLRQKGVMIYPLSWYYIEGKPLKEEYILGFTRMKKEDMIKGIEIIGEVLYSK
jgi:GntR family transcriptional regulator/MocR family aminotransferase